MPEQDAPELPFADDLVKQAMPAPSTRVGPNWGQPAVTNELPYADDMVKQAQPQNWPGQSPPPSGSRWDAYVQQAPLGRILNAFGHGAAQGWGTDNLGLSAESEDGLKKAGILPDIEKGQGGLVRSINEALIRPAAAGLDAVSRGFQAVTGGVVGGGVQAATEVGGEQFGRGVGGVVEATLADLGSRIPAHPLAELPAARAEGVIGEGEAGWKGTADPTTPAAAADAAEAAAARDDVPTEHIYPGAAPETPEPEAPAVDTAAAPASGPPADIHAAARQIAPRTFDEYDALDAHKTDLRQQITDAQTTLQRDAEAQAPHAAEIADLQRRMEDTTPRLAKKYQARLDELTPAHDAFADSDQMALLTRETPEIQALRDQLQHADYRMRDLAPDVTAAYREAAKQFPESQADPVPTGPSAAAVEPDAPVPVPAAVVPPAEPTAVPAQPVPAQPRPASPEPLPLAVSAEAAARPGEAAALAAADRPPIDIREDVAAKLQAAGRPADEATAAAEVVNAGYAARAARFKGAKGTAADLYRDEAPDIVAGRARARVPEMAQQTTRRGEAALSARGKIRLSDGHSVITLMKDANASTFIHETGHDWLEKLMSDVKDSRAPADLVADGNTVRTWLGAGPDDAITVAQHEKFARGFERYMMEGTAPSRGLAGVFQQFKGWLTGIYQTVARLRAPITDNIRQVFDRMLATPDEAAVIAPDKDARELTGHASITKPATPYEPLPKEPQRLIGFLKDSHQIGSGIHAETMPGGLRDPGGDISAIIGGPKGRPGLINNRSGQNLDDATLRAHTAGYFPEHDQRPEINHLLDAIREDHEGTPRYSMYDEERAQTFRAAMDHNAQIDRLASEHGIDTKGLTTEQFYDRVSERLTGADTEAEIRSQEEAHAAEANDVEAELRDNADEAWASELSDGNDQPRTLEDLDNAYRQEAATRTAGEDAEDSGVERAARSAGEGEEGGGPRGRGAGSGGRAGTEAGPSGGGAEATGRSNAAPALKSKPPTGPNQPFEPSGTSLIDKAGNIRLDNLNQPEDINQIFRDAAASSDDFWVARRGIVSDRDVADMAGAMGLDARELNIQKLRDMSVNDGVPLAVRVRVGREMAIQTATAVRDAMTGTDPAAYLLARNRHLMVQETLSGITAEWGRAGRAFQSFAAELKQTKDLAAFLRDSEGKTLFQIQKEMKTGSELQTPQQIGHYVIDTQKKGFFDWIQAAFLNALLSGPFTHAGYTAAGEMYGLFRAVGETGASAAVGAVRRAFGAGPAEYAHIGEMPAQLYGMYRGARNGSKAAWQALKSGESVLPDEVTRSPQAAFDFGRSMGQTGTIPNPTVGGVSLPIGHILESPSRLVAALHSFNWTTFYSQSISGQAFRVAMKEGLEGQAFADRVAELTTTPTDAMIHEGSEDAYQAALMKRPSYDSLMGTVSRLTNWGVKVPDIPLPGGGSVPMGTLRPLKYIDPFVQIASNVQKTAFGRGTPLAFFSQAVRDDLAMKNGGVAFDRTAGRILAGTGFMIGAGSLAAQGLLNGSGPSDRNQSAEWQRIHGMPHGLTIGSTSYDMLRLGNLGMQMSVAADLYHVGAMLGHEDASKVSSELVHAFAQNFLDESFMRGPASIMQAAEDSDRYGSAWVRNFVASSVPFSVGMSQVAREVDPYSRQARTTMDAILAKIPGESETLLPRYDVWGQPVANRGWALTATQAIANDPVDSTLYGLGIYPSLPERKLRGIQLTDQQYAEFSRTAGITTKMRLDALINSPGFTALPRGLQTTTINDTIKSARETAGDLLVMRSMSPGSGNNIVTQALTAKRSRMIDGKPQP